MSERDELFRDLHTMWSARDPMPENLPAKVLAALGTEDVDAEYELLTLVERSRELQGVRSTSDTLTIEFSGGQFTMLLRISELDELHRRVDGWVAPAKPMRVTIRQGSKTYDSTVGRLGRFEFPELTAGLCRIWLTSDDSGDGTDGEAESLFATPTFEL